MTLGRTGVFGSRPPATATLSDVLAGVDVKVGVELLRVVFEGEGGHLAELFPYRAAWPDVFRSLAPFADQDPDEVAEKHLTWRMSTFLWRETLRYFEHDIGQRVTVKGKDHLESLASETSRYLLISYHLRDYALLALALAKTGTGVAMISNFGRGFAEQMEHISARHESIGAHRYLDSKDPLVLVRARKALAQGLPVMILPDVFTGGWAPGEPLVFMGEEVAMMSSWRRLSLRERLPVIPCYAVAGPDLSIELIFGEPAHAPADDEDAREIAQRMNSFFEDAIGDTKVEWQGWTEAVWRSALDSPRRVCGVETWDDCLGHGRRRIVGKRG